ncbi:MAG: RNA-binding S4 domain-containing protein, partial [Micrococcales bacterium]|nr:RNA-binding S4 domain-containing protein [Micrococcales bacterium]
MPASGSGPVGGHHRRAPSEAPTGAGSVREAPSEAPTGATPGGSEAGGGARPTLPAGPPSTRVDRWVWAVRLTKTRALAAAACRAGHVRVNGDRAKPATTVRVGDEVRVRGDGPERIVDVAHVIERRVGPVPAAACYVDRTPPPPPPEHVAAAGVRERGAGRPTKRERRELDRLRGRD